MATEKLDYDIAYRKVKDRRASVSPNNGFIEQLKIFRSMNWELDTNDTKYHQVIETHLRFKESKAFMDNQ
jgi:hypothetical protein